MNHFTANMNVAGRCFLMGLFHTAHAFVPIKYTSHEYWGYNFRKDQEE